MRFGVIGTGVMGRNHARVVTAIGHRLVGVADPDIDAAREVGDRYQAPAFESLSDLRGHTDVDAVVIASPTVTHEPLALEALEAGLHVLVEKPIASDVQAGARIVAAAEEAGRVVCVGQIERYNPVVTFAKSALAEMRFGRPITISARRVSSYPGRIRDVGCILDIGIHDIDVLNHLVGAPPQQVYAVGGRHAVEADVEDHANLLLTFPNGILGAIEVNWLTPRKVRRLALTCDGAFVGCDYMDQAVSISRTSYPTTDDSDLFEMPTETRVERIQLRREEPLRREIDDFAAAVHDNRPPLADGRAGVQALAVAEAALRSLGSGRPEAPEILEVTP